MTFRKWAVLFSGAMLAAAVLLGLFNYAVDPFGVFGDSLLRWHSYNMVNNPRIAKIAYLDQYHERYDSYIIGGSKSSSLDPALLNQYYGDAKFYSMLMYGGDFHDYEKTLYYLVEHYEVKHIVLHMSLQEISHYNVNSESFDPKKNLHAKVSGQSLAGFYFRYLTLHPKYSLSKLEGLARRAVDPDEFTQIKPEDGVYNKVRRDAEELGSIEDFLANHPDYALPIGRLDAYAMHQNVEALRRMKEYCEARGISFTFVAGAASDTEMASYSLEDLMKYWIALAEVTDFWDFSGYTPISSDPRNFYDSMHYRNSVGRMMLAYMFQDETVYVPPQFGHYTTKDNVKEHSERIFTKPPVDS